MSSRLDAAACHAARGLTSRSIRRRTVRSFGQQRQDQNSGVVPKYRPRPSAVSVVIARRPSTMSLTRERGTLIAFASLIDADAHRRQKLIAQNLARARVATAAPEWTAGEIYLPSIDIRILSKSGCRPRDGCPSSGAFRKLALPCQRVSDDGL
jgi:hypothetical protein